MKDKRARYISEMEDRLNRLNSIVASLNDLLLDYNDNLNDLKLLENYYGSSEWFQDREDLGAGKFPNGLKCGVLSEDAVYNFLRENDYLLHRCISLADNTRHNRPDYDFSDALHKLLSIEYNCNPEDFNLKSNILTPSKLIEGRRIYSSDKYFFHMVTTGANAVITASEELHSFLNSYIIDKTGHWLFEFPNLLPLENELNKYGYTLSQNHHMFLPKYRKDIKMNIETKWYEGKDIHQFYGDPRFPNAICSCYLSHRPDRMVVCAYVDGEIVGMAGCSEDAPGWMQIGIDVMPEFRSNGIGTYLVNILKNRIHDMECIPFYGTSVSNYHSWNIALNCGFHPAWVEIGAIKLNGNNNQF